jgi:hypothetical protein
VNNQAEAQRTIRKLEGRAKFWKNACETRRYQFEMLVDDMAEIYALLDENEVPPVDETNQVRVAALIEQVRSGMVAYQKMLDRYLRLHKVIKRLANINVALIPPGALHDEIALWQEDMNEALKRSDTTQEASAGDE